MSKLKTICNQLVTNGNQIRNKESTVKEKNFIPVTQASHESIVFLFKDIDECVNHTCQNGGSCNDGVNNFSCNCLQGFTGDRCETGTYFPLVLFVFIHLSGLCSPVFFLFVFFFALNLCLFDHLLSAIVNI